MNRLFSLGCPDRAGRSVSRATHVFGRTAGGGLFSNPVLRPGGGARRRASAAGTRSDVGSEPFPQQPAAPAEGRSNDRS